MSGRSRVLALVTDAWGARGGIAQYNRDFLLALSRAPGAASIDVLPRSGRGDAPLTSGIRQQSPPRGRAAFALRALLLALRRRPSVIFCGHVHMAALALLLARLTGAKLVIQTHGIEIWRAPSRLQRPALERAELVLSVSRFTRAQVLTLTSARPERVVVIPNTVDEAFVPGDGSEVRRRLGLADRKMLLSLSRLDARERYKGQDRVIQLIRPLVEYGHDAVFVIGGEGDDRPRLESLAREHGVADRVIFLGPVRDEDRAALYRTTDLYVMPSAGEGFGISFLEAMACGAPAVGLDAGGAPDALCGGELGAACTEDELLRTVEASLREPPAKGPSLAERVTARFGPAVFRTRVEQVTEAFL